MRRSHPEASRILSAHGSQAWLDTHPPVVAHLKGRALQPVAGDWAIIDRSHAPPLITEILPQENRILRSEGPKTKVLAANIDLAILVVSGHPVFSAELGLRVLASLNAESIPAIIALNKVDLIDSLPLAKRQLQALLPRVDQKTTTHLGPAAVQICEISCRQEVYGGIAPLLHALQQQLGSKPSPTIALIGQSGMGKSSLLNRMIPEAQAQTQAISEALQTGRHTTTVSRGYLWAEGPLGQPAWVIDTPGFQRFGLSHLSTSQVAEIFPDWAEIQSRTGCKFYNCMHQHEPGCAIKAEIEALEARDPSRAQHLGLRRSGWLSLLNGL
ncbi:MAG: hypothetical protein RLZZ344_925 [Pseudomonadota bacterium]